MQLPELVTLPLSAIKPYENNPRRIPEDAITGVAESIERYGYTQPIVVDKDHVIIVGHTRMLALERLGWTEAAVYVADLPEDKAKAYRLVDNRTGEMSGWDHSMLVVELREWEESLLERFFPEMDLEVGQVAGGVGAVTQAEVDKATEAITQVTEADPMLMTHVKCPACFGTFEVQTKSLPGLTQRDLNTMLAAGDGVGA
jgi:hypothetical protein